MYNKTFEKLDSSLLKNSVECKKEIKSLSEIINELSSKRKTWEKLTEKEVSTLDSAEYAYTYLKDSIEWANRVRVALTHADIFLNEYNKING